MRKIDRLAVQLFEMFLDEIFKVIKESLGLIVLIDGMNREVEYTESRILNRILEMQTANETGFYLN